MPNYIKETLRYKIVVWLVLIGDHLKGAGLLNNAN